jgi:hypothetical protein
MGLTPGVFRLRNSGRGCLDGTADEGVEIDEEGVQVVGSMRVVT